MLCRRLYHRCNHDVDELFDTFLEEDGLRKQLWDGEVPAYQGGEKSRIDLIEGSDSSMILKTKHVPVAF